MSSWPRIQSFLKDSNGKKDVPLGEEKVNDNIAVINTKEIADLGSTAEDTWKMKELVKVLDVLEEVNTLIEGDKYFAGGM
jgi:hypothetical protein